MAFNTITCWIKRLEYLIIQGRLCLSHDISTRKNIKHLVYISNRNWWHCNFFNLGPGHSQLILYLSSSANAWLFQQPAITVSSIWRNISWHFQQLNPPRFLGIVCVILCEFPVYIRTTGHGRYTLNCAGDRVTPACSSGFRGHVQFKSSQLTHEWLTLEIMS